MAGLLAVTGCGASYTMAPPTTPPPVAAVSRIATLSMPADREPGRNPAVVEFIRSHARIGEGPLRLSAPSTAALERARATLEASDGAVAGGILHELYEPSTDDAPVVLSFRHYGAATPGCAGTADFGCATRANLAAQLGDPRDLAAPRAMSPADMARREAVLQAWRAGQPTATTRTADESGVVSDVIRQ